MAIKGEVRFSLKDELFNKEKVAKIAGELAAVYPDFSKAEFIERTTAKFPELELMQRLYWIRDCLRTYLPEDYRQAVAVMLQSLPKPCDPALSDDDFGDFIYGPYGAFVAEYGCNKKDLVFSLRALKTITIRHSVEFSIRVFINAFPKETLAMLAQCSTDKHYHIRRLASEGTRPTLPWAQNIVIDYQESLILLDVLYADSTRYVTRSVANHLNDISKIDPDLVIATLKRWRAEGRQSEEEMDFIVRHSLRTLEKKGHTAALQLLGYQSARVTLDEMVITTPQVTVGDALKFICTLTSTATKEQKLLIDYHLYFQKAGGSLVPKTFKIARTTIKPGETLTLHKRQPLRPMTTRTLYPGEHQVELQINGKIYPRLTFVLQA